MKSINIAALVLVASLFLSLLSGLNQVAGFFSRISLPTAILSGVIAIVVAVTFPELLRRKRPPGETILKMSFRVFSIVLAVVILAVGVGPFVGKYCIAAQAKSRGTEYIDRHLYSAARVELNRAASYFEDLGFSNRAVDSKLILIEAYSGIGNFDRATELMREVEDYANLSMHQEGKLNGIRGNMAYESGEFEQAEHFYQKARQTIEPNSQAEAIILQNQAVLWSGKGAPYRKRVLENYQRACEIYQELNDEIGLVHVLINEGNLYENDPEQARSIYEEALSRAESLHDSYLLGVISLNIGLTYRQQGDLVRADELYHQALLRFEDAADLMGQAQVMANLAALEIVRGRKEVARQHLQASEAYLRNIDATGEQVNFRIIAGIRTTQADIYDAFGESETARDYYEEALVIYSEHPDPLEEAGTIINYAGLLVRLNQGQEARNQLERAREILETYAGEGPHQSLGVLYGVLGMVYQGTGDLSNALVYYEKAIDVFEALEDSFQYAQVIENRGIVRIWLDDFEGLSDILEAWEIYHELENRDNEVKTLFNLYSILSALDNPSATDMVGQILYMLDNYSIDQEVEAGILFGIEVQDMGDPAGLIIYRERLQQLKAFYEQRDEPIGLGRSLVALANVEQNLGNYDKMVEYAREAEAYTDDIPLPLRISFHEELGYFLVMEYPEGGIDHFVAAFDLARGFSIDEQRRLAHVIKTYISIFDVDREKYRMKAQQVLRDTDDAEIRSIFQEIVDLLSRRDS